MNSSTSSTSSPPVRAVLFDLDGTLLDTAPDMVAALNALRIEERLGPLAYEHLQPFVSHGAAVLVRRGFPGVEDIAFESLRARFLNLYGQALAVHTRPYYGVLDALAILDSVALPWGIVTNKPSRFATPLLEKLKLRTRAAVIVCGDTVAERKPHPAPLLHAACQLNVDPAECVYLGDTERDVLAARAAGMPVYVALYGYISAMERPFEWPASGWIDSAIGLIPWVRSLIATADREAKRG